MRKMKKITSIVLAAAIACASLTACGKGETTTESNNDAKENYTIGVCQMIKHAALDASYEGFVAGLADAGYVEGENITIDFQNAQGEASNCNTIANKFVNDDVDLMLAIATQSAQSCANATKDIPIVVTAVTDPKEAGLVQSNELPGTNVTGTSDLNPIKEQVKLLQDLVPEAKTVAILYCSSESNSVLQAELAKAEFAEVGITAEFATVSNSNEIQQVVQSLVGKVDALYTPTDNVIAAGMANVAMVANENNLPIICGEENHVTEGGLAAYGIDYYKLGYQTAAQAVKFLKGEAIPAEMPIEYQTEDLKLTINQEVADKLGITIPEELKAQAAE